MTDHSRMRPRTTPLAPRQFEAGPERLVALGFRYWTLGCKCADSHAWEKAFQVFDATLGHREARLAVSSLSSWVACVNNSARHEICVGSPGQRRFCRDECLAVSMVAACQHDVCPALKACAFSLIEASRVDEVMNETETFATILRSLKQTLSPACLALATELSLIPHHRRLH